MLFDFFKKFPFGLDISDFSIKVFQFISKRKVKAFAKVTLKEGIVKDGFILNKEKLAEKIKEVVGRAKIKSNKVILSLPESKVFIHIFQMPKNLRGRELRNAVSEEAEKKIPLEPSKIYWDCQVVSFQPKSERQSVLYVGISKEIVDGYIEVLDKAELKPLAFDIESAALGRSLLKDFKPKNNVMIVDIGARTTNINIFNKDIVLIAAATVPVAGNQFTKTIAAKLKISLEKAEKLKRSCGLSETKGGGKIMFILQKELQPIIEEIKKTINFYGEDISKILLVGGSAQIPKLTSYFSTNLNLKTNIGKSPIAKKLKQKTILFNTVIGLALRALERDPETAGINLIPLEKRPKPTFIGRKLSKSRIFSFLIIGFVIVAFVFLGWVIYSYIFKPLYIEKTPIKAPLSEELRTGERVTPEVRPEETPLEITPTPEPEEEIPKIVIQETPTGWLRVREKPGTIYPEITKVYPGESYPLLEESAGWYKIELEDGRQGWVSVLYASKK